MPAVLIALALVAVPASECQNARTTIEANACLAGVLDDADRQMDRYYDAAVQRLRSQQGPAAEALTQLASAQAAWRTYRDAECGAVFTNWRDGSVRVAAETRCRIGATRMRTFSIWWSWLTYADSTPPILPRPDVSAVLTEGLLRGQ